MPSTEIGKTGGETISLGDIRMFGYAKFEVLIRYPNGDVKSSIEYTGLKLSGAISLCI